MNQNQKFQGDEIINQCENDLIQSGLISSSQLAIAKISKENLGLDLGAILIKKGFVSEKQLLSFLADKLSVPFISLSDFEIKNEIIHRIPLHIAKQHKVIPLEMEGEKMKVAMANPFDSSAQDDIRDLLRCDIIPHLVSISEIDDIIQKNFSGLNQAEEKIMTIEVDTDSDSQSSSYTKKMEEMASGPKVVAAVNNIIAKANMERASDIHIEPGQHKVRIRYRIDGLLRDGGSLAKSMHLPVVSRVKILSGLDIAEKRIPQDGRVRVRLIGKPVDLRISTCPTQYGEKIVIRLLSKDAVKNIEGLGFKDNERRLFNDIISKSHGIFLSTGPTGSGKSTTLYAALSRLNSSDKNIISIEDPIENEIEGVNQVSVNTKTGLTFASVLRSVLRQDPDVIMLGEIRDSETAQIAVRAAITGHMVLSTLHTNTAAGAISRLEDLGVESFLIASALKGVMAQRLVRRVCSKCKEENKNPNLKLLGNKAELIQKVFKGKGCEACYYSGFSGRAGIFELAPITDEIVELIHKEAQEQDIVEEFRRIGIKSIQEDGIDKINQGITTIEEVMKVTQED